jgi:regulator of replication initiation timing
MNVLEQLLEKIDHLEKSMVRLLDERLELKTLVNHLQEENNKLDTQNTRLEQELSKVKQNAGLPGAELKPNGVATVSPAIKTKLDEYIKEIEKCIAQLNE